MPISGLIAASLAGLLGGAHCLAMCGGFMTALSGFGQRSRTPKAIVYPARTLAWRHLPYNLGRITTYAALGAVAGGAGGAALAAGDCSHAESYLSKASNELFLKSNRCRCGYRFRAAKLFRPRSHRCVFSCAAIQITCLFRLIGSARTAYEELIILIMRAALNHRDFFRDGISATASYRQHESFRWMH